MVKVDDQNHARDENGQQNLDDHEIAIAEDVDGVISTIGSAGPSWGADPENNVSLQQMFVNDVELPISQAPMFGHVCVKGCTDIHFGDKNVFKDGVTIEEIFYPNPNSTTTDVNDQEKTTKSRNAPFVGKAKNWLIGGIGSFLLIAVVVCVVVFLLIREDPPGPNEPRIFKRAEWKAQPPLKPWINLSLPVPFVVISHTETDFCFTQSDCVRRVSEIQTRDLYDPKYKFDDISYNFLVGGDGNVYEGRGWDHVGAHTWTYNTKSVGISLIGNFNIRAPEDGQLLAAQQLLKLGVYEGKIAYYYKLIGHRQNPSSRTTSPGDFAYDIITKWPHWVPS